VNDKLKDFARLARAEGMAGNGPLVAKINGGSFVIAKETLPIREGLGFDADKIGQAELERRTDALISVIDEKVRWEREQIVAVLRHYADHCAELAGNAVIDPMARASYKIRAAILDDAADKVSSGWGRDPATGSAVKV